MNNTRFATAMHIMVLLAKNPSEWLTSEWISGSINVNAVVVRREIGILRKSGLIVSRQGKEGGSQLARNADSITISEVYSAVAKADILGRKNQNPNPLCSIGKDINKNLSGLFDEADRLLISFLEKKSLQQFSDQF